MNQLVINELCRQLKKTQTTLLNLNDFDKKQKSKLEEQVKILKQCIHEQTLLLKDVL